MQPSRAGWSLELPRTPEQHFPSRSLRRCRPVVTGGEPKGPKCCHSLLSLGSSVGQKRVDTMLLPDKK